MLVIEKSDTIQKTEYTNYFELITNAISLVSTCSPKDLSYFFMWNYVFQCI